MDPITLGLGGSALGGLMGLLGGMGRKTLDFGIEQDEMKAFSGQAGDRSNEMMGYGRQFMDGNSQWYKDMYSNMGRQYSTLNDSMRSQGAGVSSASAYNRLMRRMRQQANDSQMGAFNNMYSQGATNAMGMFGLGKDFSGQQLGGMQIGAAMKEKQWESENAGPESWQKAGMGLLGTFGGSMLGSDKIWGNSGNTGTDGFTGGFNVPSWNSGINISDNNMFSRRPK